MSDRERSAGKPHTTGLGTSPFAPDGVMPAVGVFAADKPYEAVREALSSLDIGAASGKRVLLKPNAGRAVAPGQGITTNPLVVAAAIDAFRDAGAGVAVGESPITGVGALEALETTGIAAVARERACPLIDLDRRRFVPVPIPDGVAIKEVKVCPEVLEYDIIVSLPVMKTHMHTGVTLAVKNMKGCLWRRSKVDLHMLPLIEGHDDKPLNIAIADMASVLRPHLSIIDGTVGMEGLGPGAGKPKRLGLVVVGTDAFAADATACALMGMNAAEIPHLRLGAERGYGIIDLARIAVSPADWQSKARPFLAPPANLTIVFPGVEILDEKSCSACQSTLQMFLKRYGEKLRDYFPSDIPVRIAVGKGHRSLPQGTLCIGNCTAKHRAAGSFVAGCPPVASQILKALEDAEGQERLSK